MSSCCKTAQRSPSLAGKAWSFANREHSSRLSDLEVRVQLLLENPSCKEGQPPDILLKSALRAENRPRTRVFSPRSGVSAACLKGRVHFFADFSCSYSGLHSKSDRLLASLGCLAPSAAQPSSVVIFGHLRHSRARQTPAHHAMQNVALPVSFRSLNSLQNAFSDLQRLQHFLTTVR